MSSTPPREPTDVHEHEQELAFAGDLFDFSIEDGLLDQLRGLDVPEPRDRLAAVVRAKLLHRGRYRPRLGPSSVAEHVQFAWVRMESVLRHSRRGRAVAVLTLVALFALFVGIPLAEQWLESRRATSESLDVTLVTPAQPEHERGGPSRGSRLAWLASENDLRHLRDLCDERGKVSLRERLLKIGGADERTRERIHALAAAVAKDLAERVDRPIAGSTDGPDYEWIEELSLGVRALLASGSTTRRGPHHGIVRRALGVIEGVLPELHGAALATALAGYLEGALVTGGGRVGRLSAEMHRWVVEQLERVENPRVRSFVRVRERSPSIFTNLRPVRIRRRKATPEQAMSNWSAPLGALADAGILLRVAPALGVRAGAVDRVRSALHAHLVDRGFVQRDGGLRPRAGSGAAAARAAMLFSYADLTDREVLRASLRGYCLHPDLFGRDLRAVHHLAWGVFPGAGWARFNQAVRFFSANFAHRTPTERASLLLVQLLYAAPGLGQTKGARLE